jgi:hypothetical protein
VFRKEWGFDSLHGHHTSQNPLCYVAAVADKLAAGKEEVMQADIQKLLKLDKSVVSRRVAVCLFIYLLFGSAYSLFNCGI